MLHTQTRSERSKPVRLTVTGGPAVTPAPTGSPPRPPYEGLSVSRVYVRAGMGQREIFRSYPPSGRRICGGRRGWLDIFGPNPETGETFV